MPAVTSALHLTRRLTRGFYKQRRTGGANPHLLRFPSTWSTLRRFCVRLQSPSGVYLSDYLKTTRGLPKGGVVSPIPSLVRCNCRDRMSRRCTGRFRAGVATRFCDLLPADDVVTAIAYPGGSGMERTAREDAESTFGLPRGPGLISSTPKCTKSIISPTAAIGGSFRRTSNSHKAVAVRLKENDDLLLAIDLRCSRTDSPGAPRCPSSVVRSVEILGATSDQNLTF